MPHRPNPRAASRVAVPLIALVVTLLVATLLLAVVPSLASAQSGAEVIRGRVTDDSARAVTGAQVWVTRGPDRLVRQDTTDADGKYSVRFDTGTGDYLVAIAAAG